MCPKDGENDWEDEKDFDPDLGGPSQQTQPHFNETYVEELPRQQRSGRDEEENDIKILVASDIHVGYGERKKIIENDAVKTLEEVLKIAHERNVDMVLLGGDLFHENNPSRTVVQKVTTLLRKYCLNDREIALEFVSDPSVNFSHSNFDRVNYEDPNINVGLPVFTIHGNHDDMTGKGLTALDPLHEAGLLNLFGKFTECDKYVISPILLRKGSTRLALYGIGSQRDDRLTRAFQTKTIQFPRPKADSEGWFNLLVLHQNRPRRSNLRSTGAYVPDSFLPSFFDLVVWGHEHECKLAPEYVNNSSTIEGDGFHILQPGSTVATSLTRDEALQKHCFEIKIRGRKFISEAIPLRTVRPMVVDELILDTLPKGFRIPAGGLRPPDRELKDEALICSKIRLMLAEAKKNLHLHPETPKVPLLRLKVTYTEEWADMTPPNPRRLGNRFVNEVANPSEMLIIRRVGKAREEMKGQRGQRGAGKMNTDRGPQSVEAMVSEQYQKGTIDERLTVFVDPFMPSVTKLCTEDETTAKKSEFDQALGNQVKSITDYIQDIVKKRVKESPVSFDKMEAEVRAAVKAYKQKVYERDYPVDPTRQSGSAATDSTTRGQQRGKTNKRVIVKDEPEDSDMDDSDF